MSRVLVAGGIAHRGAVHDEQDALRAQALAARAYFARQAPAAYRRNLDRMDTWKPGPDLYRTCVPGPDPARSLCVIVKTDQSPPGVTRDTQPGAQPRARGAARRRRPDPLSTGGPGPTAPL